MMRIAIGSKQSIPRLLPNRLKTNIANLLATVRRFVVSVIFRDPLAQGNIDSFVIEGRSPLPSCLFGYKLYIITLLFPEQSTHPVIEGIQLERKGKITTVA